MMETLSALDCKVNQAPAPAPTSWPTVIVRQTPPWLPPTRSRMVSSSLSGVFASRRTPALPRRCLPLLLRVAQYPRPLTLSTALLVGPIRTSTMVLHNSTNFLQAKPATLKSMPSCWHHSLTSRLRVGLLCTPKPLGQRHRRARHQQPKASLTLVLATTIPRKV